ncbi:MAG: hypothetical protein WA738_03945 [Candidatus Angelobacter sp.]
MRCRTHGMMGPAVLITLGVLFLLDNYGAVPFVTSLPVLLLVIGAVLLISRTGSTEGHIDPNWYAGAVPPQASAPQQWTAGAGTPPPPSEPTDQQVKS